MLVWARVEPTQFQTMADAVTAIFKKHTEAFFYELGWIFFLFHCVPQFVQMTMQTDPAQENFRTSQAAIVIYIMICLSTITQGYIAKFEIQSYKSANSFFDT